MNPQNYEQVELWYRTEFRRSWLAVAASWLLILAIALGALAGVRTALASGDQRAPQLGLIVAGGGSEHTIIVSATISNARSGAVVVLRLTGEPATAEPVVLMDMRTTVNQAGSAVVNPGAIKVPACPKYRLVVLIDQQERGSLTVP